MGGCELVDGVEIHVLDPGNPVVLGPRQGGPNDGNARGVTAVAVGNDGPDQRASLVQNTEVKCPSVYTPRDSPLFYCFFEACQSTGSKCLDIPTPLAPAQDRAIAEPGDLSQPRHASTDFSDDHPTTTGPDIHRSYTWHDSIPQRRKAAATPESTGISVPVVRENSSETSAVTAIAMCSGRTSRLSRVRWA